jgi:hypothetical protein
VGEACGTLVEDECVRSFVEETGRKQGTLGVGRRIILKCICRN